jgi:hypothetical protein
MKVVYCHHVRNIGEAAYSDSNYERVSNSLRGAAEMDSWAGIATMSEEHEVYRFEYSNSEARARLVDPKGKELGCWKFSTASGVDLLRFVFLRSILRHGDLAIARNATPENVRLLSLVDHLIGESIWWLDTPFLLDAIPDDIKVVIRSHNFEALHALGEVSSPLKYLHFLLKWRSERRIAKKCRLVPISPRDRELYKLHPESSPVLPLRQLSFISSRHSWMPSIGTPWIYYSGASYKVLHNLKNSKFIVHELAPRIQEFCIVKIFGSGLPDYCSAPNIQILGFARDYYKQILLACAAVVPYHGGAGMQSKVFEPLVLGIPLIADPRALAGYEFVAGKDYLGCETLDDYVSVVQQFTSDSPVTAKIASRGQEKALNMFSHEAIREVQNFYLTGAS